MTRVLLLYNNRSCRVIGRRVEYSVGVAENMATILAAAGMTPSCSAWRDPSVPARTGRASAGRRRQPLRATSTTRRRSPTSAGCWNGRTCVHRLAIRRWRSAGPSTRRSAAARRRTADVASLVVDAAGALHSQFPVIAKLLPGRQRRHGPQGVCSNPGRVEDAPLLASGRTARRSLSSISGAAASR